MLLVTDTSVLILLDLRLMTFKTPGLKVWGSTYPYLGDS
jgi:hypothetical protein